MRVAEDLVKFTRLMKQAKKTMEAFGEIVARCSGSLERYMEEGEYPLKAQADGATVSHTSQVWASPQGGDHARLTAVLDDLGLDWLKPGTVNSQTLSSYVREHLDPDKSLDLETRIANGHPDNGKLPPELVSVLKISDPAKIKVTGA
jgi:hypothetical protein